MTFRDRATRGSGSRVGAAAVRMSPSVPSGPAARAWRAVLRPVRLEELDQVSGWVLQQDLLAAHALDDIIAEAVARGLQPRDIGIEVLHHEVDAVPAAGFLCLARWHRRAAS